MSIFFIFSTVASGFLHRLTPARRHGVGPRVSRR